MKKTLLLVGGLLVSTMIGSASQISALCTTPGGSATGANPSFTGVTVTCGDFNTVFGASLPVADYLVDAFVVFQNDYQLGAGTGATATFTWSGINANLAPPASYTDVVTGGFSSGVYTPSGTSVYDPLSTNSPACSTTAFAPGLPVVAGGCASNPTAFLTTGTFTAATVSGTGSGLQNNGSIGVAAYVFYDYAAIPTGAPEPTTLALFGAALIGLGVAGRKRIRG